MADMVGRAYAYLRAWNATFKTHYYPGIADHLTRFGKTTRLIPRNPKTQLNGTLLEIEVRGAANRSTRASMALMDPMPDPGPGHYARYQLTFDHTNASNNDFVGLEIGFRTTFFDMLKRGDSNWKGTGNPVRTDFEEGMQDVQETFARYFHLPTDGKLATVHATTATVDDDADNLTDSGSYSGGSTTARILLQPVSVARIGIGQIVQIHTSGGTMRINNVKVVDVNPFDKTIDVRLHGTDTTGATGQTASVDSAGDPVPDFDDVSTSDTIYLNGSFGVTPKGTLAEFFDSATYYNVTRTTFPNQILRPIIHNLGTARALTEDHWVQAGETVTWQQGDSNATGVRAVVMGRDQYRAVRKLAKDGALNIVPAASQDVGAKLKRVIGEDGFVIHDPHLGQIAVAVEDFAEFGQIDFLDMATWEIVTPFGGEFQMIPGPMEGIWTRETEDDGSGRPSKTFSANGIWSFAFINRGAKRNLRLRGLDTAA